MKRPTLLSIFLITAVGQTAAQPRTQQEPKPQPTPQEIAACLTYLQQTGQLPPQKKDDAPKKDEKTDEQKFQEAAGGIFASMLTVISGAASGSPLQVAGGIFGMFSTAFLAATRSRIQDEETSQKRSFLGATRQRVKGQELPHQMTFKTRRVA